MLHALQIGRFWQESSHPTAILVSGKPWRELKAVSIDTSACCWTGPRDAYSGYVAVREVPGPGEPSNAEKDASSEKNPWKSQVCKVCQQIMSISWQNPSNTCSFGQKIHFNFNLQQRENGKHFQATKGCPILVATRVSGYVGWPGDETVASRQVSCDEIWFAFLFRTPRYVNNRNGHVEFKHAASEHVWVHSCCPTIYRWSFC